MINFRFSHIVGLTVFSCLCMLILVSKSAEGLVTIVPGPVPVPIPTTMNTQQKSQHQQQTHHHYHRQLIRTATSGIVSFVAAFTVLSSPCGGNGGGCFNNVALALADDAVTVVERQLEVAMAPPATTTYSINKCDTSSKSPCVSTSNVRQLDMYVPPWTFPDNVNTDEVMARLKGAIEADPLSTIVSKDDKDNLNRQLSVDSKRKNDLIGGSVDRLEFIINESDGVVTFRSSASLESTGTDFGLQRKRLEQIRQRSGIFGVMGDTLNTADTKTSSEKGNGPLGQLKAFYGLQSGGGFEDVLAE